MTSPAATGGNDAVARRRKSGWLMIVCGWAGALVLMTLFFGGVLEKRNNPNSASVLAGQKGELFLRANPRGHYYAEGELNGKRAKFLLDTGATQIAVPQQVARRIGLREGALSYVSTAGGFSDARDTTIDEVIIGPLVLKDLSGVILPDMQGDAILLGMNALGRLDITQRDGVLKLTIPAN